MNDLKMIDLSSNNGPVDLRRIHESGIPIIAFKATEGNSHDYTWAGAVPLVHEWHEKFHGIAAHYHFMHPGGVSEAIAEADFFVAHVKPLLGVGSLVVVDHETKGESNAEVGAFIDRIHDHLPHVQGLQYAYSAFFGEAHLTRHDGWGLWVAAYGGKTAGKIPTGWPTWDAWQYTATGRVPGVTGDVDESHIRPWMLEPTLHSGDVSIAVRRLKGKLHAVGYRGFVLNDVYGGGTERAVLKFKRAHPRRFGTHPSGRIAGARVWAALDAVAV